MRQILGMALAAVTLAACAHEIVHEPTSTRSSAGQVSYRLPPGGDVSLVVVGYDLVPGRPYAQTSYPAVRVQMTLANGGTEPWTVHPREQLAFIEDHGPNLPALVSDQPLVVAPGEIRTIDLYYPVADPTFAQSPPRRMTVQWRVRLPAGVIGERARLDRELASAVPPRA